MLYDSFLQILFIQVVTYAFIGHNVLASPVEFEGGKDRNASAIDPKDFVLINGKHYYFSLAPALFDEAARTCKDLGYSFLSLETQEESDAVMAYMEKAGISNTEYLTSGVLVGNDWLWSSTGVFLNYNNWYSGQPNEPLYPYQNYIYIWYGQLWDASNFFSTYFICEETAPCNVGGKSATGHQENNPPSSNFENTVHVNKSLQSINSKIFAIINGKRYYFSLFDATFYHAEISCQELGFALVSLETQEENDAIAAYIFQESINAGYWTSGVRVYDQWLWSSTGKYFSYQNWASGQPNEPPYPNQACVYYRDGLLWDYACTVSMYFICEEITAC